MTNETDSTWYVVAERSDGSDDSHYEAIRRKNHPSSRYNVIFGPCTHAAAYEFRNAQRNGQLQTRWRQEQAERQVKHAERMRTDAVYRAEHEARVRQQEARAREQRIAEELAEKRRRQQEDAEKRANNLAHDIIDAGYKTMSKKLHPDAGGFHGDMLALERARELLRSNLPKRTTRYVHRSNYELRRRQREMKAAGRKVPAGLVRELKKRDAIQVMEQP
jgi:hypothetical protein